MTNPEIPNPPMNDFELNYGWFVYDLIIQSRTDCHGNAWVAAKGKVLADIITEESGLKREEVERRLSEIWGKVHEMGTQDFLKEWHASVLASNDNSND